MKIPIQIKNISQNFFCAIIVFIMATAIVFSQNINLSGEVFGYDINSRPIQLPGAKVFTMPSNTGVLTSNRGTFSISVPASDEKLIVSFIGYETDTILISRISDKNGIRVQLKNVHLEGVEVVDDKVATQLSFSSGVRSESITTRGLQKAACCNLSESFTTTPSVDVQYSDAVTGAKRIQLLGLQSVYSQVQSENMPMMRGLAANYGFAFVPGQWLEAISISKGASTVKNGYESISGLINVDYKKSESEYPTFLNFYTNSDLSMEVNADHTINFSDKVGTVIFLHSNYTGKENDHNKDGFIDRPTGYQFNFMNR